MIYLIKYKIQTGESPSYRLTVNQLAKIFNLDFEESKEKKRNVTKILNGINKYLKYTNFNFKYVKGKMKNGLIQLNLNFPKRLWIILMNAMQPHLFNGFTVTFFGDMQDLYIQTVLLAGKG